MLEQDPALAKRQAELAAQHRDLTKSIEQPGSTGNSLRSIKGFADISDEHLSDRATFDAKAHLAGMKPAEKSESLNLAAMSPEELKGLSQALNAEQSTREADYA